MGETSIHFLFEYLQLEKKEKMTMVTKLMRRVLKQGDYIQKHLFVLK